jgi:sugar O-acyltransferase (sialic acid O-acetyltransferase NeuD family)
MKTNTLNILGFSEATLVMLFDIMESNNFFPNIKIVNNIDYKPTKSYTNEKFKIKIVNELDLNDDELLTLGVTQKNTKLKVFDNYKNISLNRFLTLISKNTDISSTTKLGFGNIINGMVCIAGQTMLDDFVFVNRNVSIGHHTQIGKFTTINPGCNIAGNVIIGENCQIGIGVNIFDGVRIGKNSIIGGGAIVTKDIPENVVAYGNPCKIIKTIK